MAVSPEQVELIPVRPEDYELLLAWRNDREVMRYLPSAPHLLTWSEHCLWQMGQARSYLQWMVVYHEGELPHRRVGVVHYNLGTGEIGLIVGEKLVWGRGLGRAALGQAMRKVERLVNQYTPLWATVHPENARSRRLFEGLGFVLTGEARNGQIRYIWQGWQQ